MPGEPISDEPSTIATPARPIRVLDQRQRARSVVRLGRRVTLKAGVDVTPAGLLSIGALVCGILLSTSVLVATAIRESRR